MSDSDDYDDDDEDWGDDDDLPTIRCPYCRAEILEDLPQCPECGNYISTEDQPAQPKPMWIVIGLVACFLIVAVWVLRF